MLRTPGQGGPAVVWDSSRFPGLCTGFGFSSLLLRACLSSKSPFQILTMGPLRPPSCAQRTALRHISVGVGDWVLCWLNRVGQVHSGWTLAIPIVSISTEHVLDGGDSHQICGAHPQSGGVGNSRHMLESRILRASRNSPSYHIHLVSPTLNPCQVPPKTLSITGCGTCLAFLPRGHDLQGCGQDS